MDYSRGRVVRALDLQFGGPEFTPRHDRLLDLFAVVPSSNPRLYLYITSNSFYQRCGDWILTVSQAEPAAYEYQALAAYNFKDVI